MFRLPQRSHHQAVHQNSQKEIIYTIVCGQHLGLKKLLIYRLHVCVTVEKVNCNVKQMCCYRVS